MGDLIWLSKNGDLNNAIGSGWLQEDEWDVERTNDFECEICTTHYLDVFDGCECVRIIPAIEDIKELESKDMED